MSFSASLARRRRPGNGIYELVSAPEFGATAGWAALDDPDGQFERGPVTLSARGTATDDRPAFVVQDRNYVSARWPGDAYLFARRFRALLRS